MDGDTLSLSYMQGMDLSEQVMGRIKLSLPLSRRPLRVAIPLKGGHQIQWRVQINLIVPHMCAVVLGVEAIGYLEPLCQVLDRT